MNYSRSAIIGRKEDGNEPADYVAFFSGAAAIAPTTSLADHPDPAAEKNLENAPRPPKPTLAVGATLDHNGRLWLAGAKNSVWSFHGQTITE